MKRTALILIALFASGALLAQPRAGDIRGRVVDGGGNPLSEVRVTLTGVLTSPLSKMTSVSGVFRYLSLSPAGDYALKAEKEGYKTLIRENIIVSAGGSADILLTMEPGDVDESTTAAAANPLIETEKAAVGITLIRQTLQALPTARDPWDLLDHAPGIVRSPADVGGIDAGRMGEAFSRGGLAGDNVWTVDGLPVADPEATGNPTTFWDFDAVEEMKITSGGGEITQQTGGFQLNLVTRRGGNRPSFGGRFLLIDSRLQGNNVSPDLRIEGLAGIIGIDEARDFGFNVGFPIFRDKVWFWGSYGVQDIQAFSVFGTPENTLLSTLAAKLNLQLVPQNRMEIFAQGNRKVKKGFDPWFANPEGLLERPIAHLGFPVFRIQDEHQFGNSLLLSLKWGAHNGAYERAPMMDPDRTRIAVWDEGASRFYGPFSYYRIDNWSTRASALMTFFNDRLFGAGHEFKLGFELSNRTAEVDDRIPGNVIVTQNFVSPQADFDGDGFPDVPEDPTFRYLSFERGLGERQGVKAWSAFFSDSISLKRFNLTVGLRYDYQRPVAKALTVKAVDAGAPQWGTQYFAPEAAAKLDLLLPGGEIPEVMPTATDISKYAWKDLQPRLALTYDVAGDGRTIVKLAFSRFASWMGTGEAWRWRQTLGGWMGFYWWDADQNSIVGTPELYWYTPGDYALYPVFSGNDFVGDWESAAGVFWGGFDYANPRQLNPLYNVIQPDAQSRHTDELLLAVEREILPDFTVQVSGTYRRYTDFVWSLKFFPDTGLIQNAGWYESAGNPPAEFFGLSSTGDASGHEWYYMNAEGTAYSPWSVEMLRPDYYEDYWGFDIVANKRLSGRWMFNGSLTLQDGNRHYGEIGLMDPTNRWAYEGRPTHSGFVNLMVRLNGLYKLPWGIDFGFTYQGRQGWIVAESFRIVDYTLPNPLSNSAELQMSPFGSSRLPFLHRLNFRIEKMFRFGDSGRIYAMIDLFNALNADTATDRSEKFYGTYYMYSDPELNTWVANPSFYNLDRILNPRVLRLGLRFQF